jgi:uncharacterized protein
MLKDADFKPIAVSDRALFVAHYKSFPQVHSDNTFTNMICWNGYAHYRYALAEGCIILSSTVDGKTVYRMPIGPKNPEILVQVLALAAKSNKDMPLIILDPGNMEWISELYPKLSLYPKRDYFDYVYRASDLVELPGKKYQTIRKQLNQFQRDCSPQVEPITEGYIQEIKDFLDLWCSWKDCDSDPMLVHEKEAVIFALSHFAELGLSGIVIRAEGKIEGMSIFESLNRDTALVHFEKGIPNCKTIYRAVNAEAARILARDYVYINRESDMGVEGIREAKTRYHPDHMVEVYAVNKEDIEAIIS